MPPIHVEMKIGERNIQLPDVLPNSPASLTDADASGSSILIVSCNPEDDGGIVYRQIPEDTLEVFNRKLRVVSGDEGEIEAAIGSGETIGLPVTTKFGKAILTLRHY